MLTRVERTVVYIFPLRVSTLHAIAICLIGVSSRELPTRRAETTALCRCALHSIAFTTPLIVSGV